MFQFRSHTIELRTVTQRLLIVCELSAGILALVLVTFHILIRTRSKYPFGPRVKRCQAYISILLANDARQLCRATHHHRTVPFADDPSLLSKCGGAVCLAVADQRVAPAGVRTWARRQEGLRNFDAHDFQKVVELGQRQRAGVPCAGY